ncbi:phosphatidylserine decarboxylase [Indivirus ILV1]|uniref:Phosphatidylserine decarboxylase n=1 Tax=Indivirus ILV1 TaxID=1977633 RepID=A0A1V0SDU9_9VIRU|nr:phosphatidylserine decarboxylase [Indivirus ILV1]
MSEIFTENPILFLFSAILLIVAYYTKNYAIIFMAFIILVSLILFYRIPNIHRNTFIPGFIYGPCYGTVTHIITTSKSTYITIFLSVFDIHSQYYPVSGILIDRQYDMNGKFALAYNFDKASDNEKAIHTILTDTKDIIKITQIAGLIARRITYDNKKKNDKVIAGSRMGMIHFGSRIDIELPNNYKVLVKEGDKINGPDTIIAKL